VTPERGVTQDRPASPGAEAARRPDLQDWTLLLLLVVLWGSAFAVAAVVLRQYTPGQLVVGRLWIGALVLWLLVLAARRPWPGRPDRWLWFGAMAVLGNALPFYLISWGQQVVPSGLTGILMAIMPLAVLPLAHLFVPGERMTPRRVAGFLLGFGGIVLLLGPEARRQLGGEGAALLPQLAILAGAVCYAVNLIVARRAPRGDPMTTAAGVLLISAPLASVGWLLGGAPLPSAPTLGPTAGLVALGLLSTGLATVIYFRVVSRAGPGFLSLINYLIPVYAVIIGALFLGESLSPRAMVALAVILTGVVVSQRGGRR
jgi:drug/metabolite transporter (DMT)-like permease